MSDWRELEQAALKWLYGQVQRDTDNKELALTILRMLKTASERECLATARHHAVECILWDLMAKTEMDRRDAVAVGEGED